MIIRENDQTQNMARAAVIIASVRSGGTFLSHCLSNHPEVFCDRGEPLHHKSVWSVVVPDRRKLLDALWNQTGYQVSMCKLTYGQALHRDIWPHLAARQPLVVWLRREDLIRQAVSVIINRQARAGQVKQPQHTFNAARSVRVELAPAEVLETARSLKAFDTRAEVMLTQMRQVLRLTYADVTGGESVSAIGVQKETGARVCAFLRVRNLRMRCDLQRVNPHPLSEMVSNWPAVRAAIEQSEFAGMLADG